MTLNIIKVVNVFLQRKTIASLPSPTFTLKLIKDELAFYMYSIIKYTPTQSKTHNHYPLKQGGEKKLMDMARSYY